MEIEGFLLTMYDSRLRLANQIYDEVKRHFQELVFRTVIQRNVKLSEAPSHGLPAILYDAESTGAKTIWRWLRKSSRRMRKQWLQGLDDLPLLNTKSSTASLVQCRGGGCCYWDRAEEERRVCPSCCRLLQGCPSVGLSFMAVLRKCVFDFQIL